MNKTIWAITMMEKCEVDERGWPCRGNKWVVGFWFSRDAAIEELEHYSRLYKDDGYNYAVIEEYKEGISSAIIGSAAWFQWDAAVAQFVPMEEPEHEKSFCSYAMG